MDLQIINQTKEENILSLEINNGKKSAFIYQNKKIGYIQVICKNAAHKVWGGMGRCFNNYDEAIEAYKSSDMKAMIRYAKQVSDED